MTQFKGTPGPWEVEDNGYFYDINAVRGTVGNVCSSASWFDNDEHRGPVAMANAQLIAAAPELLGALRDIITCFDKGVPLDEENCGHEFDKARAAINKATGETK